MVESTGVSIGSIMDIEHFSSYEKLIDSTAYVISFVSKLKQLIGNQEDSRCGDREEDLRRAEVLWLRDAQDNRIRKEWKNQFVLYLDEDKIWRCFAIQHKTPNHSTEGSSFNKTSSSESSSSRGAFRDQGYLNGAEKSFLDTSGETEFYSSVCYLLEICCS